MRIQFGQWWAHRRNPFRRNAAQPPPRSTRQPRSWLPALLPGSIAAGIVVGLGYLGFWQPLERLSYNRLLLSRNAIMAPTWDPRVVVIAIDETSLQQYGRFPWSRDRYAQLLQVLDAGQPAAIGFDVLFSEPSPQDGVFAEALHLSGNVVLAIAADYQGQSLDVVPALAQGSRQGHVYNVVDLDGISRHHWVWLHQVPSLGRQMLTVYHDSLQNTANAQVPAAALAPPPALAKLDQSGDTAIWINWAGAIAQVPTYSFAEVVAGKVPPQAFTNKLVLVGITATGFDPLQTPFNQMPPVGGVYLHAAVLDNLLQQRWLWRLPDWVEAIACLGVGLVTSWLLYHQSLTQRLLTIAGLAVLGWGGAIVVLISVQLWVAIAAPLATVLLTAAGLQLREQYEKQLLMQLFARHVAPETAQMLWQRKGEIFQDGELRPQELVATVLFMDIRGFTSISEKLPPSELLTWVNRYLDSMTTCIMDHQGVVDKYIGDAIMAVFGVPFPHTTMAEIQQDALNAIAASLDMQRRLQELNQDFAAEGQPLITCGIGIHTGLVIAGSVGGARRLSYSVLGDAVNVAARLESMNKDIQVDNPYNVLITCETLSCIGHHYDTAAVGTLQLRGREQTTLVYSILGEKDAPERPLPSSSLSSGQTA